MRKRKLLTITAVAAACLCICWGATAFAGPGDTPAAMPKPQPVKGQTPPNTMVGAGDSITVEASSDTIGMKPVEAPSLAAVDLTNEGTWEGPRGGAYTTGFESPFTLGWLSTQQGWSCWPAANLTQPTIANTAPQAGTQHLKMAKAAPAAGTAIGCNTPLFSPAYLTGETYQLSMQVRITATGGADYYVEPHDSVSGTICTRVDFGYAARHIFVFDHNGTAYYWRDTGALWTLNAYGELKIVQNLSVGGNIKYYYNSVLIFEDTNGITGVATTMNQVSLYCDSYQTTDFGYFDAFAVANLAGSGACCAAGGTGVCSIKVDLAACTAVGGTWKGAGTTCTPNPCLGACCNGEVCTANVAPTTCTTGGGTYLGDGTTCGPPNPCVPLVYNNTGATSYFGNAYLDLMVGDDVLLDPLQPDKRVLRRYVVEMYGTAVGYNLTCQLYTRSGNVPGTPIAGTSATWTAVAAGWQVLTTPEFGGTIALPDSLFVVYTISGATASCGPLLGQHAELPVPPPEGTEDFFVVWNGSTWDLYSFSGTPPPWAGFQAKVYCWTLPDDGACCNPNSPYNCTEHQTAAQCAAAGGTFYIGQLCTPNICKGACCNPVDGTCTEVKDLAACTALSGTFRGAGTTCPPTPACYTRPACQPTTGTVTLFGQQPYLPDENWSFGDSDLAAGFLRAEKFEGTSGTIKDVHWWGLTLDSLQAACDTESPMTFAITFYNDDGLGLPLATPLKTYTVSVTPVATGLLYAGYNMKYFSATLPPADPWYQLTGWVGIQGTSVGTPDCWFYWAGSPFGNAKSALKTGTGAWAEDTFDLSICVTGTSGTVVGACCMDETTCEQRAQVDCQPPYRWEANKTCAQMSPACGKGACCSGSVGAKICTPNLTETQCLALPNGVFQFGGTTCTPDPCNSACCKPNHTGCVLTDSENCGILGGVFMAAVKTCTPDPCPPAGANCADPNVVTLPAALPFTYTGSLCMGNDLAWTCMGSYAGGEDMVFQLIVTQTICVDIAESDLGDNYSGWAIATECQAPATCLYVATSGGPDNLAGVTLAPGTYYLAVDYYPPPTCPTGNFTLSIVTCAPPTGACCNGTACTVTLQGDCLPPAYWRGVGTVCTPNPCTGPTCPTNSLWGQVPYTPDENWTFDTSDTGPTPDALLLAEYYSGVAANICDVHWWGITAYFDGTSWSACTENPMTFDIIFYADAGGFPGAAVATYAGVSLTGAATGLTYSGFPMLYYSYTLPTCVPQAAGWVSIQGVSLPATCWFLWAASPQGNANSASKTGTAAWLSSADDLALCLTGAVAPPTGACCQLSGYCEVKAAADCAAPALWQGPGTTCSPNLCPTYCATCRGDVSGNNVLNGGDVQAFVNCVILGGPVAQPCACADINQDGFVNLTDINLFVAKLIATAAGCPPP